MWRYQPACTRDKLNKKAYYDQHAKDLPDIQIGQHVRMHDKDTNRWSPAVVTQMCTEPRSYIIKTPSGQVLRRNRKHLREDPSTATRYPPEIIPSRGETNPSKDNKKKIPNTPSQTSNHHVPQESHTRSNTTENKTTKSGRIIKPPARYCE